jgi:hypothetical protein
MTPAMSSSSLRPSLLGIRLGLRLRKRRTERRPPKLNSARHMNQDGLSFQLIRSSSETFLLKAKLVLRRLNSIDYTEASTNATCSSSKLSTTTAT